MVPNWKLGLLWTTTVIKIMSLWILLLSAHAFNMTENEMFIKYDSSIEEELRSNSFPRFNLLLVFNLI